jgi:hypothetical protein
LFALVGLLRRALSLAFFSFFVSLAGGVGDLPPTGVLLFRPIGCGARSVASEGVNGGWGRGQRAR